MSIMKRIHRMTCNHTDADGTTALKFVRHHDQIYDSGRMKAQWTTYKCKHCGRTIRKNGLHEPEQSSTLDDAYFDRNQAAMALARYIERGKNGTVGIKPDADWPILFIELPFGQVSWHIPAGEIDQNSWPEFDGEWDGHTLKEKRQRITDYINSTGLLTAIYQGN